MTTARYSKDDVVAAAGRLFAERGYHGTSMRDLGRALGLHGSSLYAHIDSKEDLLVAVVERGARLFEATADAALATADTPHDRLLALIRGHIDVVLDHRDEARTFLDEARSLDGDHRGDVVTARDRYEAIFRSAIAEGVATADFRSDVDVPVAAIFVLSMLNGVDRWFDDSGRLGRGELADLIHRTIIEGLAPRT